MVGVHFGTSNVDQCGCHNNGNRGDVGQGHNQSLNYEIDSVHVFSPRVLVELSKTRYR